MSAKEDGKENSGEKMNGELTEVEPQKGRSTQENLLTKIINFDHKSYFLDVRQNKRGEYLKVTESTPKKRSTILLSGGVVGILMQVLNDAIKGNLKMRVNDVVETVDEGNTEKWVTVFSRRIMSLKKKIYFDIMENSKGRSLNIAEVSSERPKTAVIISEHGWFQFQRSLDEIMNEFPSFKPGLPRGKLIQIASKKLSMQGKTFYFDLNENDQGRSLKITELRKNKRESLYVPMVCMRPFIELIEALHKNDFACMIEGLESVELTEASEKEGIKTLGKWIMKVLANDPNESKVFNLDVKENDFGKFLRINELRSGKSSALFFPFDSFEQVNEVLLELSEFTSPEAQVEL